MRTFVARIQRRVTHLHYLVVEHEGFKLEFKEGMKKVLFFSLLVFVVLSCDNDIELFGEITETPIVYGLLSSSDTVQYVRLERSFADPETGALTLAQDPNNVYYQNAQVFLTQEDGTRIEMQRVNAEDEGYVRREGDFLTSPNFVYRADSTMIVLTPGDLVTLEVVDNDEVIASSSTVILDDSKFRSPRSIFDVRTIGFETGELTSIRWDRVENASNYAISFDMIILERNIVSGDETMLNFRWDATSLIADQGGSNEVQETVIDGQSFFGFIRSQLEPQQDVDRKFIYMDIRVTSYGEAVGQYLDVINANSGITGAQEVPTFTNINNGLGLFSAKNETLLLDLSLTSKTLDSLYDGSITGDLNFTP